MLHNNPGKSMVSDQVPDPMPATVRTQLSLSVKLTELGLSVVQDHVQHGQLIAIKLILEDLQRRSKIEPSTLAKSYEYLAAIERAHAVAEEIIFA